MDWITNFYTTPSVGSAILFLSITITMGLVLGRIKIGGVSLGITWILFVGILFGHLGIVVEHNTLHFAKEFGLILFVYAIGLQVGPGFFESFKQGGLKLNILAVSIVLLGVGVTVALSMATGVDLSTMTGIYTGAITNTPGLGAAQQTYNDIHATATNNLAMGYAAAYPLGVIGIIFSILLVRWVFRVKLDNETSGETASTGDAIQMMLRVSNGEVEGKSLGQMSRMIADKMVVANIRHADGSLTVAVGESVLRKGDILEATVSAKEKQEMVALIGEEYNGEPDGSRGDIVSRRIAVTNRKVNGLSLGHLHIRTLYGVNVTRVHRSGIELMAKDNLQLLMGDRVSVVGSEENVEKLAEMLGNKMKHLDHPNIVPIFLGIFLGILVGSIPIRFPGLPMPVKLGLAGGPLIVAILIGRFGPYYKMVTYTTTSANLMLREVGICLFLAAVGLDAGGSFSETILNGGYMWVLYGLIITLVPLIVVGFIARGILKIDYLTISGMIAGSTTDPPALAYVNGLSDSNKSSVAYATVYPLTMFLRILTAQILILIA